MSHDGVAGYRYSISMWAIVCRDVSNKCQLELVPDMSYSAILFARARLKLIAELNHVEVCAGRVRPMKTHIRIVKKTIAQS